MICIWFGLFCFWFGLVLMSENYRYSSFGIKFGRLFPTYRISANSFRGNYSFLNLTLCTVTFGYSTYRCGNYSGEETIQGRKLFAEIRYVNKHNMVFSKSQTRVPVSTFLNRKVIENSNDNS